MIASKQDYDFYLKADKIALYKQNNQAFKERFRSFIIGDEIWQFEKLLRKVEYYQNCKDTKFWQPYYVYLWRKLHKQQIRLGLTIFPNCFGPGLSIVHTGTLVVHPAAKIGANCRIHTCTVIGRKANSPIDKAPKIGNNVYIGSGVKIFGDITLADGIAIGANAVVNKSFLEPNITIAGVPAKKISEKGSEGLIIDATSILENEKASRISK